MILGAEQPQTDDTRRVLVIGYGNTMRADDGAGVVVTERLAEALGNRIAVVTGHQLLPEMVLDINLFDTVIFVDASVELAAGEICFHEVMPAAVSDQPFGHQMRPEALLAMAGTLYDRVPTAYIMAVGAATFEVGQAMSEPVTRAVDQMVSQLTGFITERQTHHA